jgi:alpha-N-arabinofuranosidase
MLITLLKHCDRIHAASQAQLVNVIAPIMTEPGGPAWRQTTFYPFSTTVHLAKGGTVLEPKVSSPTYHTDRYGEVPSIDSVAVRAADGSVVVFAVNRSQTDSTEFEIALAASSNAQGVAPDTVPIVSAQTLHDDDIYAKNTLENQNRVVMKPNNSAVFDQESRTAKVTLPPVSWTAIVIR